MTPDPAPGELTTVFALPRGMLLREEDATAAVQHLTRVVHQAVPAAAGAGVPLIDENGVRITTAATDSAVEAADALQYQLEEGPCPSAWATSEVQRIDDTAQALGWVRWEAAVAESGIRSVLSVPLVHRKRALGAMKVYACTPGAFGDAEERLLELLAEAAATLLGAAQAVDAPARLSTSLEESLQSRDTVGLAVGVLMARAHLDSEAARSVLLEQARAEGRRVGEIALEVLDAERDRRR